MLLAFAASLLLPWADLAALWREDRAARAAPCWSNCGCPAPLLALTYGAMLGAAGAAIQALFANPLASPDLTGTTSGAALGAVVTAYLFGFSAPLALVGGLGGRRARPRSACCSLWPGRAPRPPPCCSPASRSAPWPGR